MEAMAPDTNGRGMINDGYGKFIDDGGYNNASYWEAGCFGDYQAPRFWNSATDFDRALSGHSNMGFRCVREE